MKSRKFFTGIVAVVSLLFFGPASQPANAIPLDPGDRAIFNFDFTGQVPPPPYLVVNLTLTLSGVSLPGAQVNISFFTEPNGNGFRLFGSNFGLLPDEKAGVFSFDPGIVDGIFSAAVTANVAFGAGPFNVEDLTATARAEPDDIAVVRVVGELAATPLPAALPLFATGLGVLGLLGWRRKWGLAAASSSQRSSYLPEHWQRP